MNLAELCRIRGRSPLCRPPCRHLGPLLRAEAYKSHCGQPRLHAIHACRSPHFGVEQFLPAECSTALVRSLDIKQQTCLGCPGYFPDWPPPGSVSPLAPPGERGRGQEGDFATGSTSA